MVACVVTFILSFALAIWMVIKATDEPRYSITQRMWWYLAGWVMVIVASVVFGMIIHALRLF